MIDELLEQAWLSTMMLQVSEAAQRAESVEDLINEVSANSAADRRQKCGIFLKMNVMNLLSAEYGFEKMKKRFGDAAVFGGGAVVQPITG